MCIVRCIASLSNESVLIIILDLMYCLVGESISLSSVIIWLIRLIVALEIPVAIAVLCPVVYSS